MSVTSPNITSPNIRASVTPSSITSMASNHSALRTRRDDALALPAALKSEWIKLSSLRVNRVISVLTPMMGAVVAWALAGAEKNSAVNASELFIYPLPLIATLATITGILMFTAEAQHGTLAGTLTARPTRWVIVIAKTVMATMVGLVLGATAMVAGFGGALMGGADLGNSSDVISRALWALLYIALAAVIGLGVGMIVRHSAGAISGLLMWSFVVESLFAPALPNGLVHFLPFSAGYRLLDAGSNFKAPVTIAHELARAEYALIFGGYAALSLAIGTALLYRRDAD